jgi:hypothetical protein
VSFKFEKIGLNLSPFFSRRVWNDLNLTPPAQGEIFKRKSEFGKKDE